MWSVSKVLLLIIVRAHLRERPLRTVLTVIGVALGVAASVAVRTANLDILHSFEQAILAVAGPTTLEVSGDEGGVDEAFIMRIRQVPGVVSANPVILQSAVRTSDDQDGEAVQVLGLDLLAEVGHRGFELAGLDAKHQLERFLDPDSVFLGRALAAQWRLAVGDPVEWQVGARRATYRVAGLLQDTAASPSSSWDRLAIMDIAAAQIAFERVGRLDRIDLVTREGSAVDTVAEAVRKVLPPHLTVERPASRTEQVEHMVLAFRLNLTVLSWVGLLVGMFLIYNTMAFAVAQRRREIGIYRALGMSERRVALLFLAEAGLFGLSGGLVGSVGGTLLAREFVVLVSRTISDLYVPVSAEAGLLVGGSQFWTLSLEGIAIGCLVAMLGAIGPSIDASRTTAVRALAPGDYEASRYVRVHALAGLGVTLLVLAGGLSRTGPIGGVPVLGYLATLCVLAGLSCLAPFCVTRCRPFRPSKHGAHAADGQRLMRRIAVDHASRNPGRNSVTVSALMVGLAIMIGVVIMVRSFRHTVELWIDDTVMADVVVAPSMWLRGTEAGSVGRKLPSDWRLILGSIAEVEAVDAYRDVRVDVRGQRVALVSRDLRVHAQHSRYLVREGESSERLLHAAETDGILVSEVLANRLGLDEGRALEIVTPEGRRTFPIVAVFYDYATDGGKLVMDRSLYQSLWHDDLATVFPVYLAAGADVEDMRKTIADRLRSAGGVPPLIISNAQLRQEILDIFDRTFLLTYVLEAIAVVIAMLGIVNTLVTSVLERRREFATLRAIGGSNGQIRQLVLWEAAYLGAVGIMLGSVGGGALSLLLIKVINKQSFGWTIQTIIPIGALAQAIGLAALATLAAGYFPARWAARQPVVEGLREE